MKLQLQSEAVADSASNLPTACVLCSHNCGLLVDVKNGKITKVQADKTNPITHGYSCNKAYRIGHYVDHAQRVTHPLKRQPDGSFVKVGWDQAIQDVGQKLMQIRDQHGPNSIALAGIGGQGNHMDGLYAIGFLKAVGSSWWFNALGQEKTQHPLVDGWMANASPIDFLHADTDHTDYLLMMGTNPLLSNRGHNASEMLNDFARDANRKLVVVDPRLTETAKKADLHCALQPGTDTYFLLALVKLILDEGWVDYDFIKQHTRQFKLLVREFSGVRPEAMAGRCGIAPEVLVRIARDFSQADSASVFWDLGIEQAPFSTLNAWLVRVLSAITGNLGKKGGNVFVNAFMPEVAPLTEKKPFTAPVSGIQGIPMFSPFGIFSPNLLTEEITANHKHKIRALVVEGANPLIQFADTKALKQAFEQLELLVVIDPAMTETAMVADYVLPTPAGYEKWEWSTFPHSHPEIHSQVRPPILTGPEQALPEAEIYARLVAEMKLIKPPPAWFVTAVQRLMVDSRPNLLNLLLLAGVTKKSASWSKMLSRLTFWTYWALGPKLPSPSLAAVWLVCHAFALTRPGDLKRALPPGFASRLPQLQGNRLFQQLMDHPEGVLVAKQDETNHLKQHVRTKDKKVRLFPKPIRKELQRALAQPPEADAEFPLILAAGERTSWNANTIQRDPKWRKGRGPHCVAKIHPEVARQHQLANGDTAEIETRRGTVRAQVKVDDQVLPVQITLPNGFGLWFPDPKTGELKQTGVALNDLTDAQQRDPFTGCPEHKLVRCRIRKA